MFLGGVLLVDGNNLLHAARDHDPEHPPGRARLCALIADWARRRQTRAIVVFDGVAPGAGLEAQLAARGLDVRFSEAQTADAVLSDLIRGASAGKRMLVVSSDRELVRTARRHKARSVGSAEFVARLNQPPAEAPDPDRNRADLAARQSDADVWLQEFGLDQADAEPPRREAHPKPRARKR